ncbi:MAG: chromosome condensation regulator [Christensenella sp.]|nr:chromosome condensation regulator [Christensenella sp.]
MKRIVCIIMTVILALGLWGCAPQGEPDDNAQGKIAMGLEFLVAVKGDGTVKAAGNNDYGQCDVEDWRDIKQVAAGSKHTVGLKKDGTVVATGGNDNGQCDVEDWKNVKQIATGDFCTIALMEDGTVKASDYSHGAYRSSVKNWTGIEAVAANSRGRVVGLKSDGTVETVSNEENGNVEGIADWTDIAQVFRGFSTIEGIKKDGTVVVEGTAKLGQTNVEGWTDIVDVVSTASFTLGLKSDGTVVMTKPVDADHVKDQPKVSDWTDIVAIAALDDMAAGLKSDGTIVVRGIDALPFAEALFWRGIKGWTK